MKEIIFISPKFFNLENYITEGFEKLGFKVNFFDERASSSSLNKVILRTYPDLLRKRMDSYYHSIIESTKDKKIDMLFVVKAENLPTWFLAELRKVHPRIKLGHYMYDPIKNYPEILDKTKLFDVCFTFDSEDSKAYNWHHRPLFYPPLISDKSLENKPHIYSGSFVGTLHTDRAKVIEGIKRELPEKIKKNLFIYYFIPLMPMFWLGKYVSKNYSYLKQNQVSTKPLSALETLEVMQASNFVIDIHHDNQSGLTTRTLEALGMKKKILTTNPYIANYDFYAEENILIVDKYNIQIDENWFNQQYNDNISYDREKYTVKGFASEIVNKTLED